MGPATHQLALPQFPITGRTVLDIGCGTGETLTHPYYAVAASRSGVDIDEQAIRIGDKNYAELTLAVAQAEYLPYPSERFEVVISKVALPYTDIRRSFAELYRVTKPGGDVFLTMHDWRMQWKTFLTAASDGAWVRCVDHSYILAASCIYITTGCTLRRPWKATRETFQTQASIRRDLMRVGFRRPAFQRTERDLIVLTSKPQPVGYATSGIPALPS